MRTFYPAKASTTFVHDRERSVRNLGVHVSQGDGLLKFGMIGGARQAAGFLIICSEKSCGAGLHGIEVSHKPAQAAVHPPDTMDPRNDFLSHVASFFEIHRDLIKAGFLRKSLLGKFISPARDAALDAQQLDFVIGGFHRIIRRSVEIDSFDAQSSNAQTDSSSA